MATLLEITTAYLISGEFDTRKRYVRANTSSPDFRIVTQDTFVIDLMSSAGGFLSWRYSDGSYAAAYTDIQASGPISWTPTYELVKI